MKKLADFLRRLIESKPWLIFLIILFVGLYLRFYQIENVREFTWDQARDSWVVRDILMGKPTLIGPKTGVGQFHLGPLYYYLLAPFYYVFKLDPMAANYFNILANIFNFVVLFWVTKKLFNNYAAIFASSVYAINHYLVGLNLMPWNVTPVIGVSLLILYGITRVYQGRYNWIFLIWFLSGLFFQLHFTAIFIPLIVIGSFIFVKEKRKVIKNSLLSLPLYLLWFVPNIIYEFAKGDDILRFQHFWADYYHGFHLRFLLYRSSFALVQFDTLTYYSGFKVLQYLLPVVFLILVLFAEKNKFRKIFAYLISLWFIIPWFGFSLYAGNLSEYYFIYDAALVIYIFWYIQEKIWQLKKFRPVIIACLLIFWSIYCYQNTKDLWTKPSYGGLKKQKDEVVDIAKRGGSIEFNEGSIKSYLVTIAKENGAKWWDK
jgi:4-amino-4-deoxy-L-arabinose transferase-like glycosyltransferase